MVGLSQQMIGIGFIISTWVGYGSLERPDTDSFQWRFPLAFQGLPAIFLVIGLFFFPESPRHLIEKDREEEALKVLTRIRGGEDHVAINAEFQEIRATIQAENAITAPGWSIMFKVPTWRRRLLLGTGVQVFTQLTGISKFFSFFLFLRPPSDPELLTDCDIRRHQLLSDYHVQGLGY